MEAASRKDYAGVVRAEDAASVTDLEWRVLPGRFLERYSEQAKDVVFRAWQEAGDLNHRHVGTEHILLGLVAQNDGAAVVALATLGVTRDGVRDLIVRRVGAGVVSSSDAVAFTQQAVSVLDGAMHEALPLGKNYVDTEHILLSVVRDNEGHALANLILHELDAGRSRVFQELKRVLGVDRREPVPRLN
jgi:ATP-dependent Clp protease ATP-binding subunit ClpC